MSAPLVSVVIPCFNAAATIERCLRSCADQRYCELEIIVVDNNSSDGSLSRVARFASDNTRPLKVLNNAVQGVNTTRNVGLAAARGDYIQFLDADDTLLEGKIERQVAALEANRDHAFAYGDWYWRFVTEAATPQPDVLIRPHQYPDMLLQMLMDNWCPPHCYLARRSALTAHVALARFARNTFVATDREYMTLAALLGMKFLYVADTPVRYYTWASTQITQATSPATRSKTLARIFKRLRRHSQRSSPLTFAPIHRRLLQQDRRLWRAVDEPAAGVAGRQGAGRQGAVRDAILRVLRMLGEDCNLERGAKRVAWHFMSQQFGAILAAGRRPDAAAVQRSLSEWLAGGAQHLDRTRIADPAVVASPQRLWGYYVNGPFFAPQYAEQRWLTFQHMERLVAAGLLLPVHDDDD